MKNKIIVWDAIKALDMVNDNSIELCFTSPPYNAWHDYDWYDDNLSEEEYNDFLEIVFKKVYKKLVKWGRLAINVPFAVKNRKTKETIFVSNMVTNIAHKIWFLDFEIITRHKGVNINHFQWNNTARWSWKSPSNPVCRPMAEAIFIFSKWQTRLPWDKEEIDITSDEFKNRTKNSRYVEDDLWYYNLLCIPNKKKKKEHPATFPKELAERIIKMYSYKWNTILDPFNWMGNTTIAAKELWRNYIWIDQSQLYCKWAIENLWWNKDDLVYVWLDKGTSPWDLINTKLIKD